jgi:hypothetical protein
MTTPKVGHIFRLAQIIQESCEHCTDQEATFLAKAILEHPGSRWCPQQTPEPVGVTDRITFIAKAVQECAFDWEPTARMVGNVCAEDVADLCGAVLARPCRPAIEPMPSQEL